MAESNGLLNRHRRKLIGGSNPPLSAIFFVQKRSEDAVGYRFELFCFCPVMSVQNSFPVSSINHILAGRFVHGLATQARGLAGFAFVETGEDID